MINNNSQKNKTENTAKPIKYFYVFSAFLIAVFLLFMLPNYNDGENLGSLIVVFVPFCALTGGLALHVFQPFGEQLKKEDMSQVSKRDTRPNT